MGKLISIWSFICRRKYLITVVAFAVIIGFLDENSKCNDGDKILAPAYETPDSDQFIHNFSFLYPQR